MTSPELYLAPTRGATTFRARVRSRNVVAPLVGKEVRGTSFQENSQTLP